MPRKSDRRHRASGNSDTRNNVLDPSGNGHTALGYRGSRNSAIDQSHNKQTTIGQSDRRHKILGPGARKPAAVTTADSRRTADTAASESESLRRPSRPAPTSSPNWSFISVDFPPLHDLHRRGRRNSTAKVVSRGSVSAPPGSRTQNGLDFRQQQTNAETMRNTRQPRRLRSYDRPEKSRRRGGSPPPRSVDRPTLHAAPPTLPQETTVRAM
ncbi:unnamed protein product [Ascophyllum nodosum]